MFSPRARATASSNAYAFRFFVTERAMAWQFDHRVEWNRRFEPAT